MKNSIKRNADLERQSDASSSSSNKFLDRATAEMIRVHDRSPDHHLMESEKPLFSEASKSLANKLRELHGIKPKEAKQWVVKKFSGRGSLDVLSILDESLSQGKLTMMERRKMRTRAIKPNVSFWVDISGSIGHKNIMCAVKLLSLTLIELFGRDFADNFNMCGIGKRGYGLKEVMFMDHLKFDDAKRWLLDVVHEDFATLFCPYFEVLEKHNFYAGANTKYIFILTDGFSECIEEPSIGKQDLQNFPKKIRQMWDSKPNVLYFFLQISDHGNMLEFLCYCGFKPPWEEVHKHIRDITEPEYNRVSTARMSIDYQELAKFYWAKYKMRQFIYISVHDLVVGKGFHTLTDYLVTRFKEHFK